MSKHFQLFIKRIIAACLSLVLISFSPALTIAEQLPVTSAEPPVTASVPAETPSTGLPESTDTSPVEESSSEPVAVGPTASTDTAPAGYTYNDATGLWEDDLYAWDPVTKQATPKTSQDHSYNSGSVSATSPSSATGLANESTSDAIDSSVDASINGTLDQSAQSGDALGAGNTKVGNATSGDAQSIANTINLLQSSFTPLKHGNFNTFVTNINGDVVGDLLVNPAAGLGSAVDVPDTTAANLKVRSDFDGLIDNKIAVDAKSGNAELSNNTTAGDATSGDANAMVNVVNLMNSSINAGESFLGVINIDGNLIGDILMPAEYLQALVTNTSPGDSTNTDYNHAITVNINAISNQKINNNITTNADTGNTLISNNTTAGNAVSGTALTNITMLNMTGRDVMGDNALLVFVNVLGKWVGMIVDAPNSTSALLGDRSATNTNNTFGATTNMDIDDNSNQIINNDIVLNARSGDATLANNTKAGNAKTGNATASANVANVMHSNLSLSGWFGIMFINVLGSWQGSFGINTSAGDRLTTSTPSSRAAPTPTFTFVPVHNPNKSVPLTAQENISGGDTSPKSTVVLASTDIPTPTIDDAAAIHSPSLHAKSVNWRPAIVGSITGLLLLVFERLSTRRRGA